jgi:hypothetical protein
MKEGVSKIRREPWNEFAYLELTIIEPGTLGAKERMMGPWTHLYDVGQHLGGEEPIPILGLEAGLDEPVWEAWEKPENFDERIAAAAN